MKEGRRPGSGWLPLDRAGRRLVGLEAGGAAAIGRAMEGTAGSAPTLARGARLASGTCGRGRPQVGLGFYGKAVGMSRQADH